LLDVINKHLICYDLSPLYKKILYFCFFLSQRKTLSFFQEKAYIKKLDFNMKRHFLKFLETHLQF